MGSFFALFIFFFIYTLIFWKFFLIKEKNFLSLNEDIHIVLTTKNQQDKIEGTVRDIIWNLKNYNFKILEFFSDIIVVDLGSNDETLGVLKKLSQEYEFIRVMNVEKYISLFSASNQ
ncbi:MAG: hypothetical protein LBJ09_02290 [Clostridiales bacterium]|nr:hypothetical protein [Clostridiales bacterium]